MCGAGLQVVGSASEVYCTSPEGCNPETCCEEFSEAELYMVVPGADSNRDYIYSSGQEADEACAAAHPVPMRKNMMNVSAKKKICIYS